MPRAALVVLIAGSACAKGGGVEQVDARALDAPSLLTDAPLTDAPLIDAPPVMIDAAPMIDAPGNGLFCTADSQCTVSGECCQTLGGPQGFCAPGTVVFGVCTPF